MNNELASAAATAPEVDLTTFGRKSGRPSRSTIWITTDAQGRIHVRSGRGLAGDWPRNLLANGLAILHIDGKAFPVLPDMSPAALSCSPGQPPTPPEQATFELVSAGQTTRIP